MQGPHHNLPAQVPGQWHKPNWRQIHLPGDQHPTTHGERARLEGITPWQILCHHYIQAPLRPLPQNWKESSAQPWR